MKKYIEYKTDTSTHLELDVYYNLWWISYFSWNINKRWIYFHIRKVKKDWLTCSFDIFWEDKDFKYLLKELKRSSKKELSFYESRFESIDNKSIIDLYERQMQLETFLELIN